MTSKGKKKLLSWARVGGCRGGRSPRPALRRAVAEVLESRQLLSAIVSTDKLDYAPGATALIGGSGFGAGDAIQLQITHTDGNPDVSPANDPWTVTADGGGNIASTWYVDPDSSAGDSLRLTATDLTTGDVATEDFTDATISVTSVTTTVSAGTTYGVNTQYAIKVAYNGTVTVSGTPTIPMNTTPARNATYTSSSTTGGLTTLTFTYTVLPGDISTRLDYSTASISGGTLSGGTGNTVSRTLPLKGQSTDGVWASNNLIDGGPTVSSLTATPSPTQSAAPTINANVAETSPFTYTITGAEYWVDNAAGTPGTGTALTIVGSGTSVSVTGTLPSAIFNALSYGSHTIYADAKDSFASGNWGAKVSQTFVKDTVGPTVSTATVTPTPTNTAPTINVTGINDTYSPIAAAEYFIDNAAGTPGTGTPLSITPSGNSATATGSLSSAFAGLLDGTHTIYVDAEDALGNWSAAKKTVTFVKDTTAPAVASLTVSPTTGTATSPSFSAGFTDNNALSSAEYFLDAAGTPGTGTLVTSSLSGTSSNSGFTLANFATLADGPHTLFVDVKDRAGNWSTPSSVGFIKDTQIPSVTLTPPAAPNQSPLAFTATFSVPVNGIDPSKLTVTGGTLGTITGSGTTYTINVVPAANPSSQTGDSVSVQLQAGAATGTNTNYNGDHDASLASLTSSATFDNVAPVLTAGAFQSSAFVISPYPAGTVLAPGSNQLWLNLTFNENVVITGSVSVQLNNGMTLGNAYFSTGNHNLVTFYGSIPSGMPTNGVALDFASGAPFSGGTLTDAAGNAVSIPPLSSSDILSSQNIQVHATDDVPPVSTIATVNNSYTALTPLASGWFDHNQSTVYFTLTATDISSSVAHRYYKVDGGSQGEYFSTHVAVTGNGVHTVTYWSVDSSGNVEAANTYLIRIDTTSPTITLNPPPATGTYGSPYTISGTWTAGPSGLSSTAPFAVLFYDYVDHYSFITVGTVTSPSYQVNGDGTWSYTFTPTTATWGNNISTPVETSNWVISVSATGGAGAGSNGVTSNSGGNIKYSSAPTAVFNGGGGSGAAGNAILTNGFVTGVNITNGGSGYSKASPPIVTFSGGGGFNAQGIAIVDAGGHVTGVNMSMITIGPAATSLSLATSGSAALVGSPVTFTATVAATGATLPPVGSVQFYDGATLLGAGTFVSSSANQSTWTLATSALSVDTHNIGAVFSGGVNFDGSSSNLVQSVVPALQVTGVSINGYYNGAINTNAAALQQRSSVNAVVVNLNRAPIAADGPLGFSLIKELTSSFPGSGPVTLNATKLSDSQYLLTFSGALSSGGWLIDGIYDLSVSAGASTLTGGTVQFRRLQGDFDGNGQVDAVDLNMLKLAYTGTLNTGNWFYDLTGDSKIDVLDYSFARTYCYNHKLS